MPLPASIAILNGLIVDASMNERQCAAKSSSTSYCATVPVAAFGLQARRPAHAVANSAKSRFNRNRLSLLAPEFQSVVLAGL